MAQNWRSCQAQYGNEKVLRAEMIWPRASTESIVDWELSIMLFPPKPVIFGYGNWLC
jgi:hypothetical protein